MTRVQLIACASIVLTSLSTSHAQADSTKQQCAAAFEDGQRSKMVGDLQRAIDEFKSCTASSCPEAAQRECSRLLDEVQVDMPAVQFELRFGAELPQRPVMLSIDDGEPRAYDREVLRVNPGKHRFVFDCDGCATVTRRIAFAEQDSKRKEVVLNPVCGGADRPKTVTASCAEAQPANCAPGRAGSASATSPELALARLAPKRSSIAEDASWRDTVVLGSAATLAAIGSAGFITLGLEARSSERALQACSPDCSSTRIADVKRSYWLANASLGLGVLALAGATVWWFGVRPARSNAASRSQWSVELGAINKVTRTF